MTAALLGRKKKWHLIEKIGEGDAGEIWLSHGDDESEIGVVKRPVRSAFGGEVYRQAGQISMEGSILEKIGGMKANLPGAEMKVVKLLDRCPQNNENSLDTFIVLERASGFDLNFLQQNFRSENGRLERFNDREKRFLQLFSRLDHFPELLLLRMVAGLAEILQIVHNQPISLNDSSYTGVVWNDVKIDHIFWDPFRKRFTIIDWGNAQFLGSDRVSLDRRFSPEGDCQQFIKEIEKLLNQISPNVATSLPFNRHTSSLQVVKALHSAASRHSKNLNKNLQSLRRREKNYLDISVSSRGLDDLHGLNAEIVSFGEAPDIIIEQRYLDKILHTALVNLDLYSFRKARNLLGYEHDLNWDILYRFAQIIGNLEDDSQIQAALKSAIKLGLKNKWRDAFWTIRAEITDSSLEWWPEIRDMIRKRIYPETGDETPLEILTQVVAQLDNEQESLTVANLQALIDDWLVLEPEIVDYGLIEYPYLATGEIRKWLLRSSENDWQLFKAAIQQPQTITNVVQDAWQFGPDFSRVHTGLRQWLVHDPERSRIFTLDMLFKQAESWLSRANLGPPEQGVGKSVLSLGRNQVKKSNLRKFSAEMLKKGQEFPLIAKDTDWLEKRLMILDELARGQSPNTVCRRYPKSLEFFPWIKNYLTGDDPHWKDEDAYKFCQALKEQKYEDATDLAISSSLKNWSSYRKFVIGFKKFDEQLQISADSKKLASEDFPREDSYIREALQLFAFLDKWLERLMTKGVSHAIKDITANETRFEAWNLVLEIKTALDKWRSVFGNDRKFSPATWNAPEWRTLPESIQNGLNSLVKAQEKWEIFSDHLSQHWESDFQQLGNHLDQAQESFRVWKQTSTKERSIKLLQKSCDIQCLDKDSRDLFEKFDSAWKHYQILKSGNSNPKNDIKILENLNSLEMSLTSNPEKSQIWLGEFKDRRRRWFIFWESRGVLQNKKHPLYPWYQNDPLTWREGCFWIGVSSPVIIIAVGLGLWMNRREMPDSETVTLTSQSVSFITPVPFKTLVPQKTFVTLDAPAELSPQTTTAVPVDTPTPWPTATPMLNLTPTQDLAALCADFDRWAMDGAWGKYRDELSLREGIYDQLKVACEWQYSYKVHKIEFDLLQLLQKWGQGGVVDPERRLRDLHQQHFSGNPPFQVSANELGADDYAHWLRASLALCYVPEIQNTLEFQVMQEYKNWHLGMFSGAIELQNQICDLAGTSLLGAMSENDTKIVTKSIIEIDGWPQVGRYRVNCSAVNPEGPNVRWFLREEQNWCPLPVLQERLPEWNTSNALNLQFCAVEIPQSAEVTFWLHQPGLDYGLKFNVQNDNLDNLTMVSRQGNSTDTISPIFSINPGSFSDQLGELKFQCNHPAYNNLITLQPVWLNNILLWRILGNDGEAGSNPVLLPGTAQVWLANTTDLPVEFYWSVDTDLAETVHLYNPVLELLMEEK
jgi:hypothetical protein